MPAPIGGTQFETIADLKTCMAMDKTQVSILGLVTSFDDNGGSYMWNATSTANDDGFKVIQVTGVTTGRWLRTKNSNTLKGSSLFSSITLTTSYTVNYSINGIVTVLPFTPAMVVTEARSANAAVARYITNITTSGFTVNFATVPILGTNNIAFDYIVIKQ